MQLLCAVLFILPLAAVTQDAVQPTMPKIETTVEEVKEELEKLVKLDHNHVKKFQIKMNFQGRTDWGDKDDKAGSRLFEFVDKAIERRPTFAKFIALLDNYHTAVGTPEVFTEQQQKEITDFLDAVSKTSVMNEVYHFLKKKSHPFATSMETLIGHLRQLWFGTYRRDVPDDSSAFEHVFLGEISRGKVKGMHNWLRISRLEADSAATHFDYKGYITQRYNIMANVRMTLGEFGKPGASFFIGTSPEFELSVHSLCFLSVGKCKFDFKGCPVEIITYPITRSNKIFIGTSFPAIGDMTESCKKDNRWSTNDLGPIF